MIRGRESSDPWAKYAHHLLDRVRTNGAASKVAPERIEWALAYLGDMEGPSIVPPMTGRNRWIAVHVGRVAARTAWQVGRQ